MLSVGFVVVFLVANGLTGFGRLTPPARAQFVTTYVVDSLGDQPDDSPGDLECRTAGVGSPCTLRAALDSANGYPPAGPFVINFAPGLSGTITAASALTVNTENPLSAGVTINGPGAASGACPVWPPTMSIHVKGTNIATPVFAVVSGTLTMRGLTVSGGNTFLSIGGPSANSKIECNFFGTNLAGTATEPSPTSGAGIEILGPRINVIHTTTGNVIGGPSTNQRNLISGQVNDQIRIFAPGNTIQNNYIGPNKNGEPITRMGGQSANEGIYLAFGNNNQIIGNTLRDLAIGIEVRGCSATSCPPAGTPIPFPQTVTTTGNSIRANSIARMAFIGIDLFNYSSTNYYGVTLNHKVSPSDLDPGTANHFQNFPVLDSVTSVLNGATTIKGRVDGTAGHAYAIDVFANRSCAAKAFPDARVDPSGFGFGEVYLGTFTTAPADANGVATVNGTIETGGLGEPFGITTTATDMTVGAPTFGDTSEFSYCYPSSTPNTSWVTPLAVGSGQVVSQLITANGQEKWFKIPVSAGAKVSVTMTSAAGSAVSLHRDPTSFYNSVVNPSSAAALSAEAADTGFLPSGFLPSGFLPSGFLPSGFLPSGFLPSGFLPSGFLPSGFLPSGFLPSGFLPSGFLPSGFLPSGFLPSGFLPTTSLPDGALPSASLPSGFLPSASVPSGALPSGFLPAGSTDAYATASRKSLLGLSADPSATTQTIERNTFDLQEDLYVRVVGPASLTTPFTVSVTTSGGVCSALSSPAPVTAYSAPASGRTTLILTDTSRLTGTPAEKAAVIPKLQALAGRNDVLGAVVDLSDPGFIAVANARLRATQNPTCPSAMNDLAAEIKSVVAGYRAANPGLKYIVLAGGADVIPFHQTPDVAGLASEKDYVPPVSPNTPSEASLKNGLVSGQDYYGAKTTLTIGGRQVVVPDLAVGRLVDTAGDIGAAVDRYIAINGTVTPSSSLVTGYDFVSDAAVAIAADLDAGLGQTATRLIQPENQPPSTGWTADELRTQLLPATGRHDLVFMSGHFSAGNLLAADYSTTLTAAEVQQSVADLANTVIVALGCHGGYTVPASDTLPGSSPDPDWAKAFLRKGAVGYVAATGYAYGDTELTEYGERLVVELARQMRTGTGDITLGEALVAAKRIYMASTPLLSGLDQKTIEEMTLYGLPMLKINAPNRLPAPTGGSVVDAPTVVAGGVPGLTSTVKALPITPPSPVNVPLANLGATGGNVSTVYYTGRDGVVANPTEPIFPKQIDNVSVPGQVLRGVALRGGAYADVNNIIALTSSPTTEISAPHPSFNSDVFYPTQNWSANFFDALTNGPTRLVTVPAQYRSTSPGSTTGTLRTYGSLDLQFYYLPASWTSGGSDALKKAAVSPGPQVYGASASTAGNVVTFKVNASNDGGAEVQAVWILYTGDPGSSFHGTWVPFDLTRDAADPTVWTGTLDLGRAPAGMRFMVQAVNTAGLTSLASNLGAYYPVAATATVPPPPTTSTITLTSPGSVAYLRTIELVANVTPATAGRTVIFTIGDQSAIATTDGTGRATTTVTAVVSPGQLPIAATVRADAAHTSASTPSSSITVVKDTTSLIITPGSASVPGGEAPGITAILKDSASRSLGGKAVAFSIMNGPTTALVLTAFTDASGVARLGPVSLPAATYSVTASFGSEVPLPSGAPLDGRDANYAASTSGSTPLTLTSSALPTIVASATTNAGTQPYTPGSWTKLDVTVDFTCTDPPLGSGIATCGPDATVTAEGTTTVTGAAVANNNTRSADLDVIVRIDRTGPAIAVTTPAAAATYAVGAVVNAAYTCTDAGSGPGTCVGSVVNGQPIDTATPGAKSFTVNATDALGNTSTQTRSYTVGSTTSNAPVVNADMGLPGLQEIGFPTNVVALTGTFSNPGGQGPFTASVRWRVGGPFSPFALANTSQFLAASVLPTGANVVTVRICNKAGVCGTDDVLVRAKTGLPLTPLMQCVTDRGSSSSPRYVARFGYTNTAAYPIVDVTLPLIENTFTSLPALRGQPQIFLAGTQNAVFTAGFGSGSITWRLGGKTVTAKTNSPRC